MSGQPIYDVRRLKHDGSFWSQITQILSLRYTLVANDIGVLVFTVPISFAFPVDARFALYRNGVLVGGTHWFCRRFRKYEMADGTQLLEVTAYSAMELLKRRIVGYKAGTTGGWVFQARAAYIMAVVVMENFVVGTYPYNGQVSATTTAGSTTVSIDTTLFLRAGHIIVHPGLPEYTVIVGRDGQNNTIEISRPATATITSTIEITNLPARNIGDWFDVAFLPPSNPDLQGAIIRQPIAYREVLRVCQEAANSSTQLGIPLYFDVVWDDTEEKLLFTTYPYQRGSDRRSSIAKIRTDYDNIGEPELIEDHTNEYNVIYSAGQGEEEARDLISVQDDERTNTVVNPVVRRERFYDGRNSADTTALYNTALSELYKSRPLKRFRGRLLDRPGSRYGLDWEWGDLLTISAFDEQFDVIVAKLDVQIVDGQEIVESYLETQI